MILPAEQLELQAVQKWRVQQELAREDGLHPGNRRKNLRRRLTKARRFPTNTCPASRHVATMADALSSDGLYWMLIEEPLHCAGSLYSAVASLWEARTEIAKLRAELEAARTSGTRVAPQAEVTDPGRNPESSTEMEARKNR